MNPVGSKKTTRRFVSALMVSAAPFLGVASAQAQTTVNPVQTSTFTLSPTQNPIVFGASTNIDTTAATPVVTTAIGVTGGSGTAWDVTNDGSIQGNNRGVSLDGAGSALTNNGAISATSTKIDSAGVFLSSGGSVTNTGLGSIKGIGTDGIRVEGGAGTITNDGNITSDATTAVFLNAGGGSVTNLVNGKISGRFFGVLVLGLPAGTVTNSGSIDATDTAAGVGVAGLLQTLTNKTGGTISGGHTGVELRSTNATIVNEANATISGGNIGITGPGSITNSGKIEGGTGAGNGSVVFTGGVGITNTLTLQTGSQLIGDAVGSAAAGAENNLVLNGNGISTNNFIHFQDLSVKTDATWTLSGTADVSNTTIHSSSTLVVDGSLLSPMAVLVNPNATLAGHGTVTGPVAIGGTVAPGAAVPFSTLTVNGSVDFQGNSVYLVNVNAAGQTDLLKVTGSGNTVTLTGGTVSVLAQNGTYAPSTQYTILTSPGGLGGTNKFQNVTSNLAFLTPTLTYDANNVFLTMALNGNPGNGGGGTGGGGTGGGGTGGGGTGGTGGGGTGGGGGGGTGVGATPPPAVPAFAVVAQTRNQNAVATSLAGGALTNPLVLRILNQTIDGARAAFDALSGEIFGSVQNTQGQEASFTRGGILGRLRQASYADAPGELGALGYAGPELAYADGRGAYAPPDGKTANGNGGRLAYADDANGAMAADMPMENFPAKAPRGQNAGGRDLTFWAQGLGGWGHSDSDGNAASLKSRFGGFLSGADMRFGQAWRAGIVAGYTRSDLKADARASSAGIDSVTFGLYAGGRLGALNLRTGASFSYDSIDTSRAIVFPGFSDQAKAHFHGEVGQVFGEVGYGIGLGTFALEPFAGLAYVHINDGSFQESGGLAALTGSSAREDTGYSSLGLRAATFMPLGNGTVLVPRASAQWQHAFGDVTPASALAFQSTGTAFTVAGIPIARDSALVEAGLDWRITPWTKLGAFYQGELAAHAQSHAVKGGFTLDF